MNPKELEQSYQDNKNIFHKYINNIKRKSKWDIFTIINPTLIKNPYGSFFPKRVFLNDTKTSNKTILFIKTTFRFYLKNFYLLVSYVIAFILYKIYYTKKPKGATETIIDIFILVDKTNQKGKFSENYLDGVYQELDRYNSKYAILPRLYGVGKNPFKLKQFFKILSSDKRNFIFEYELLKLSDFLRLLGLIIVYPFKLLRLLQKEDNNIDKIFNQSLLEDIKYFSFDSLTRYILGKNISKINSIKKIYSWSEFQVIERSFNYAVRNSNANIEIVALQFYLNYEIYFNAFVDDLDYDMLSSPHKVLVNGRYYIHKRDRVKYEIGVSLRYKDIFLFDGIKEVRDILLLGSYIESDTKYMLECTKDFDSVIFKNHPAVDIKRLGTIPQNITISDENIYKLFENTKLVIATASGTAVEAVACGLSVMVIASNDNLTANPLVEYGKHQVWDIAFNKNDVKILENRLTEYRKTDTEEIAKISKWYRDNFFVEPTKEKIIEVFELQNGDKK
ncbi:MAG: hypothetical protein QM493_00685 [Sulfurovum sp.]